MSHDYSWPKCDERFRQQLILGGQQVAFTLEKNTNYMSGSDTCSSYREVGWPSGEKFVENSMIVVKNLSKGDLHLFLKSVVEMKPEQEHNAHFDFGKLMAENLTIKGQDYLVVCMAGQAKPNIKHRTHITEVGAGFALSSSYLATVFFTALGPVPMGADYIANRLAAFDLKSCVPPRKKGWLEKLFSS
jgi:hypothetical protein